MKSHDADVIVVGAGPAGSAAAVLLARAGKRVVLADRAHFPRDKCCGDGLTGAALVRLEGLGLSSTDVPSWLAVDRTVFVSPSGRDLPLRTTGADRNVLAIATRSQLDAALVDLARVAGARVIEGARLDSAVAGADSVTVGFGELGDLTAPFVVAADGAWSPTRRALDSESTAPSLHKWQAARAYVRDVDEPGAVEARVWFDPDVLPGYAWSFPLAGGRANVGVGTLREAGGGGGWIVRRLDELLQSQAAKELLGTAARAHGRALVWPIPTELRRSRLVAGGGRVLFAGDAVGATDPMTGEGIAEALQTGELAAAALIAGRPTSYAKSAGRALAGRHRRRQFCSTLLRSQLLARGGVRVAGTSDWARAQFTRWIFE